MNEDEKSLIPSGDVLLTQTDTMLCYMEEEKRKIGHKINVKGSVL